MVSGKINHIHPSAVNRSLAQLEDMLRRACAETVRTTKVVLDSISGTELDAGSTSSAGVNGLSASGIMVPAESPRDGGVLRQPRSGIRSTACHASLARCVVAYA